LTGERLCKTEQKFEGASHERNSPKLLALAKRIFELLEQEESAKKKWAKANDSSGKAQIGAV
jgi:hypothetical protein